MYKNWIIKAFLLKNILIIILKRILKFNFKKLSYIELKKELTITDINKAYVDRIIEKEPEINAFVTTLTDNALEEELDSWKEYKEPEYDD